MSQLISLTITNRGPLLEALKNGPTIYAFDVEDIVSPIKLVGGIATFVTRTNKDGATQSSNGSKINYQCSETITQIAAKSPLLLKLLIEQRRGVLLPSPVSQVFVASKITENLIPDGGNTKFYYIEDGDPLPVEYITRNSIANILSQSTVGQFNVQDNGTDVANEPKLNFIGFSIKDIPGVSTNVIRIKDINWEELKDLRDSSALPVGAIYRIVDRFNYQGAATGAVPNSTFVGDDRGYVYIRALAANQLSKEVIRIMYCPLHYDQASYGGFDWDGVWHSSKPVNTNELMIRGGRVWQNLTGNIGTAPSEIGLDGTNWVLGLKEFNNPVWYVDKQFSAIYDFDNDWFEKQWDGNGNEVGLDFKTFSDYGVFSINFNPCDVMDWNSHDVDNGLYFFGNKLPGGVFNNVSDEIYANIGKETSFISGVVSSNIQNNNVNNYLKDSTVPSGISQNTNLQLIDSECDSVSNNLNTSISNSSLGPVFNNVLLNASGLTLPYGIRSNYAHSILIDVTGLTTIDLTAYGNLAKFVELTYTAGPVTINNVIGLVAGNDIFKFTPQIGKTITFTNAAGNLLLEGGVPAVLDGTNGDWISFETVGSVPGKALRQQNIGTY